MGLPCVVWSSDGWLFVPADDGELSDGDCGVVLVD
jgi:hypothetical protein